MNELVNLVSERTGMPADTAQTAVETVIGYLKDRLPGPVASQIDSVIGGGSSGGGEGGPLGGLGKIFGGR